MTADCFCFIVRGNLWRIAGLRQLALLDLSILNFGLMRACRREDAPLRIDRYAIRDGFLLVRLISGANRDSSSENAVSFSWARTFLRGPLRDQTHRKLVYRPLQFDKRSQLFIHAHNENAFSPTHWESLLMPYERYDELHSQRIANRSIYIS